MKDESSETTVIEVVWTDDLRLEVLPPGSTEPPKNQQKSVLEIEIPPGASVD